MKLLLSFIILLILLPVKIYASSTYQVIDEKTSSIVKEFDNPINASTFYDENISLNANLSIRKDGKIVKTNYAIAKLKTDNNCLYVIKYIDQKTKQQGEINACFASDGAYIDTNDRLDKAVLKISGVNAEVSIDDVELINYNQNQLKPSSYIIKDGIFYHHIKTQLEYDYYGRVLNLYQSPDNLNDNQEYFSYDGVYFYDEFSKMINDYRKGSHENSVNAENPYYNYYLFLPHRSLTNYNSNQLKELIQKNYGIDSKITKYIDIDQNEINDLINQSQFYDEIDYFYENQYVYGTNALMLFSAAAEESSFGRSLDILKTNNYYLDAAFESDRELQNNRYNKLSDSIYAHSKYYLSSFYSDINKKNYSGSHFGNKSTGINKDKSNDPYWGENLASNYAKIDITLGLKDYNSYAIGLVFDADKINFYSDENLSETLFVQNNIKNYPLIILKELSDSYLIQLDSSLFSNFNYDFNTHVAYVEKTIFNKIINKEKINFKKYFEINFDAGNGSYKNFKNLKISVPENKIPTVSEPYLEGYEFVGYDKEVEPATKNETYFAKYQKIISYEVINKAKISAYHSLDLSDLKLILKLENGKQIEKQVTADMIIGEDIFNPQKLEITYSGFVINVDVDANAIDLSKKQEYERLKSLLHDGNIGFKDGITLKKYIDEGFNLDFDEVRKLDLVLSSITDKDFDYVIEKNDKDLSISGLSLIHSVETKNNFLIPTVIKAKYNKYSGRNKDSITKKILGNGYEIEDYFNLSFYKNYDKIKTDSNIVVGLKINDEKQKLYTVFYIDNNDNIIKLKTTRTSDYVQFLTRYDGNFVIAKKNSSNIYNIENKYENLNYTNSSLNKLELFIFINSLLLSCSFIGIVIIINIRRNNGKNTKNNCC